MTRLLLLVMLLPLSCDGSGGIPANTLDSWTGWQRYRLGSGTTITDLNCDITWNVAGTVSSASCRDCTFAFDLALTVDEDQSTNDGSCFDVDDTDLTYGYVDDWNGAGPTLGTVTMGEFYPVATAAWNESAGTLTFAQGNLGYEMGAYYYVDYLDGYGLIGASSDPDDDTGSPGDDTGTDRR